MILHSLKRIILLLCHGMRYDASRNIVGGSYESAGTIKKNGSGNGPGALER